MRADLFAGTTGTAVPQRPGFVPILSAMTLVCVDRTSAWTTGSSPVATN
jgi:hypothetical protein